MRKNILLTALAMTSLTASAQTFRYILNGMSTTLSLSNHRVRASALGLGAVWTALYPRDDRAKGAIEVLKLPEHIVPLCAIIIGYPAEKPEPKDKWKPENVSYNEFGGKAE